MMIKITMIMIMIPMGLQVGPFPDLYEWLASKYKLLFMIMIVVVIIIIMGLQVGPFPDLYEWLAEDWLGRGKASGSL
jgi:hypothetical protein